MCTSKLQEIKQALQFKKAKQLMSVHNFGTPKSKVQAIEIVLKDVPLKPNEEYYVYQGPDAERDFCVYMLKIDKVFSRTEIDTLSVLMGYDVFEYEPGPIMPNGGPGGPNCKHKWRRFRGKFIISGNVPTNRQIDSLVSKSIFG